MAGQFMKKITHSGVIEQPHISGLFNNVRMQGAQKIESRGVYKHTLSSAVCRATPAFAGVNSADVFPIRVGRVFKQHSSGGFTLVEILIAIFILGLVMSTVYVSYSGTLKVSHQIEEEGNIYKMARMTMDRMIRDLSSLQTSGGSFSLHAEKEKINKKEFHSLYFWSAAHLAFGENESESRPATITYYVHEDENEGSFSLWRSDVSGAKLSDKKETEEGYIICKNIDTFRLTFYDNEGRETDLWDSASISGQHAQLPASVKIELAMVNANDKEKPYKFMTRIFLPSRNLTP